MTEQIEKPRPTLTIKVNGDDREIFMSFALLNRITYLMGDSSQIPLILQDPELREVVLVEALAERDKNGKVLVKKNMDEMDVTFDAIQDVLEFVSEHVADFTLAAMERATKVMVKHNARIQALAPKAASASTPSPTGQENSASKSAAASPSA